MSKAAQFVDSWLRHRLVTVELVDMVDDDSLNFKPWDGAMTLGELAIHIVTGGILFGNAVKNGVLGKSEKPPISSMRELKKFVHEETEKAKEILLSITDEQMESQVDVTKLFGTHLQGKVLLAAMRDHEIHHKGQLFVYARMTGVQNPPSFVKSRM